MNSAGRKILGISGSPRHSSNSDALLREILGAAAKAGAQPRVVCLRDLHFSSCNGCEQCRAAKRCTGLDDDMQQVYRAIDTADTLVLVTPIHNYNMTALMKAFIDRLYCYYEFGPQRPGEWRSRLAGQGRRVVLVAIGEQTDEKDSGMDLTLETLRRSMTALGYETAAELPVLGVYYRGQVLDRSKILKQAAELGRSLA
ncbi:MAG: flavodoxin family protein [Dehalogenimonas sp.]|nr:flavodoxin family protein [Dehalogenimonas sp.]